MKPLHQIYRLLIAAFLGTSLHANVSVPGIFANGAVLQVGPRTPIWGWADPGESVTVTFGAASATTTASPAGSWRVELALNNANATPQNLVIQGNNLITINDVLVGEVWLCSGQSNMQRTLAESTGGLAEDANSNMPLIRQFKTNVSNQRTPLTNQGGSWTTATPGNSKNFTGVGYYFAKKIHAELAVPVGIINSSVGGTPIEAWTSIEAFEWNNLTKAYRDAEVEQLSRQADYAAAFNSWMASIQPQRYDNVSAPRDPYTTASINPAEWTTINVPTTAETPPITQGNTLPSHGAIWIRRSVVAPVNQEFKFDLGILGFDEVYWNSEKISSNLNVNTYQGRGGKRLITVPGSKVFANNTLAIRIYAPIDTPTILISDNLLGSWLAKAEYSLSTVTSATVPTPPVMFQSFSLPSYLCSGLFNGMINPCVGYGIRGVNWYQGEANNNGYSGPDNYKFALMVMIQDWRRRWGQGDFFFNVCQLANYGPKSTNANDAPRLSALREGQAHASKIMPNTELANLIDLGEEDIHPGNKKDAGDRLGLNALSKIYGKNIIHKGPTYKSMSIEGSKIRITFDDSNSPLVAKTLPATYWISSANNQSAPLVRNSPASPLEGFAIKGATGNFVWANASIDGNTVLVDAASVPNPTVVKYAWQNNPTCNLHNQAGLPALSFRTDEPALPLPPPDSVETSGAWIQGTSHIRQPGADRALVVMLHGEGATSISASGVTYGGRSMTKVVEKSHSSATGSHIYAGAFVLNESGIAAATSGNISVTWSNPPSVGSDVTSAFFSNVDQAAPTATASNGLSGNTTISTTPLTTSQGDLVLLGASAQSDQTYKINSYFFRGMPETKTSFGDITTAFKYASGNPETPGVSLSAVSDQAIVAFVLRRKSAMTSSAPFFNEDPIMMGAAMETLPYTGQTLAGKATDADTGDALTFSKDSGPTWLVVNANGALSGTPPLGSIGVNEFVVRATDSTSLFASATLRINVTARPSGPTTWITSPANQNWGDALNWSLGVPDVTANNPTYFTIGNCAAAQFPIIEGGNYYYGAPTSNVFQSSILGLAGSTTARLDIRSGSLSRDPNNGNIGNLAVAEHGSGPVLNVANTAITGQSNLTGYGQGSGSLSVRTLFLGTFTGTATLNIHTTGSVSGTNFLFIGNQGTGVLNLTSGNVFMTNPANGIVIGNASSGKGTFNIEGGTMGDGATKKLGYITIGNSGSGTLNQTGGSIKLESILRLAEASGSNGTMNLESGSLTTPLIQGGAGTSTFNFKGGTLVAKQSHAGFFQGLTQTNILTEGAKIDTGSFDVTIAQSLQGAGGLTKLGSGILTLTGNNTYTGGTTINSGKLALGASSTLPNASNLSIGVAELRSSNGIDYTIGTLDLTGSATIHLAAGSTLTFANSSGIDWTGGTLDITGNFITGSSIRFGTTTTGLTPAQLAAIRVNGTGAYTLNPSGYLMETSGMTGFARWSSLNAQTPEAPLTGDMDSDGVLNGIEYVIGGTKDTNDQAALPEASVNGNDPFFTFIRDQASICPYTTVQVETSSNLVDWPNAYKVGADTATSSAEVAVAKDQPVAGKDTVTLRVPLAAEKKAYARLKVTIISGAPL